MSDMHLDLSQINYVYMCSLLGELLCFVASVLIGYNVSQTHSRWIRPIISLYELLVRMWTFASAWDSCVYIDFIIAIMACSFRFVLA